MHITLEQVVRGAWQHWLQGKLLYQGPLNEAIRYSSQGRRCAVGAGLTLDEAEGLDNLPVDGYDVESLVREGAITTDDLPRLAALQAAHDKAHRRLLAYRVNPRRGVEAAEAAIMHFEGVLMAMHAALDTRR